MILNGREFFVLTILALAVLIMGLYPQPVIEAMHSSFVKFPKFSI